MSGTTATVCGVAWLASAGLLADQRAIARSFDGDRAGVPPPGFTLVAMRQPSPGAWAVRREGSRGWLEHTADPDSRGYSMAIAQGDPRHHVIVSARMRLSGGSRVGGLVWRYTDAEHYYAAILDLGRGQISMYRITGGHRIKLEFADHLELDPEAWHTLKVVHAENLVYVTLGGIRVFEERGNRYDRTTRGLSGVLAAGDATVSIDDLRIEEPRERR